MSTHPQLARLQHELEDARRRAHDLARRAGPERWTRRPAAGGWAVGHCIEHLNITSESFLPHLERACDEARRSNRPWTGGYRMGLVGWLFCKVLEPPSRMRARTPSAFDPADVAPAQEVLSRFDVLQARLHHLVEGGEGLALGKTKVVSPFSARVKYSAYAAFRIIAAHQRRHLWQAERVLEALDGA